MRGITMRVLNAIADFVASLGVLFLALFLIAGGALVYEEWKKPQPVTEVPAGVVLRRLEIRLHEPLDKGRGDRYRLFECSEVAR